MSENKGDSPQSIVSVILPGNTNRDKTPKKVEPEERPAVTQLAVGKTKKPSFFSKVTTTFTGEDARSVGDYLFFDVMIPAVKNTLWEMLSQGSERMLFGSSSTRSGSRPRVVDRDRGGHIPYGRMSTTNSRTSETREISNRDRATHNFDSITVANREEAELILNAMGELVEDYGQVRVSDFYEMVGITGNHVDDKWGWFSMVDSGCKPYRGEWLIVMPKAEYLD